MSGAPRLNVRELLNDNAAKLNELMEKHSYVILTNIGKGIERKINTLNQELGEYFQNAQKQCLEKQSKQVYRNERGVPMWYIGYEKSKLRSCYRIVAGDPDRVEWPNEQFRKAWMELMRVCIRICDKSLELTLKDKEVFGGKKDANDVDYSVCYGLYYPNLEDSGQSASENVLEHVDPSLYVIEPVCHVKGLQVYDRFYKCWVSIEEECVADKELVLFGGKALSRATEGRIQGALHKVERSDRERICFIYEQKYESFF